MASLSPETLRLVEAADERGRLVAFEFDEIDFPVRRMFQVSGVPVGVKRGGHSHRECHQVLIASAGVVEVACHDGTGWSAFVLDRPSSALHVPPGVWAEEIFRTDDALLTVLTSHPYDRSDYLHDFEEFLRGLVESGE